jgi:hypothetical protein
MNVTIITPDGAAIFAGFVDDWAPISEEKEITEVGLAIIEEKHAKMLRHTLEFHGIKVSVGTDYLLILPKPKKLRHRPKDNDLYLNYES